MLSLAGREVKSARSGGRKIDIETETRRKQQTRQQREAASDRLDAELSGLRPRDGKKRPAQPRSRERINLTHWRKYRYGSCYFFLVCVRSNLPAARRRSCARSDLLSRCSA